MESDLVIWLNLRRIRFWKRHDLLISTENGFDDIRNAYNTRESILRNCAVHRIDEVILQ